jgi:hypothetical protein
LKIYIRFLLSALIIIGLILPLLLVQAEYTPPVVWSNKREYDPSETAYLFGYGFKPFTQVNLTIVRPDSVVDTLQTSTDEFGYFTCQYRLDGVHGNFNVTATDGVNVATTTFENCLYLKAWWDSHDSIYLYAKAGGLNKNKYYYIKYFDPAGVEKRQSPTYTGVRSFKDNLTILPTFPNIFGWWTVNLYENDALKRTKTVYIDRIVWTTDSTYTNLKTSFAQGETVYFKTKGLKTDKYYRFKLELPNGTWIYVGDWTTGVTEMVGSYLLPLNAPLGTWKLHVREASDSYGTCEHHYVDCRFEVTTPPPPEQYYLTVRTDPAGIGTIPGEGWYNACTLVNLTAPEYFPGPADNVRYRFSYWDVDGTPQAPGVSEISIHMDANHTATAHYVIQYYLSLTTDPPGVTTPAGVGWYDAGTNASIFAPEFISIVPGASRYRFNGWTTGDMSEIADPSSTSTTVFMDKAKTVTAHYVKQYKVNFDHTGLDDTALNTVLTVNGSPKTYSDLPYGFWVDEGSVITYSYEALISSTVSGKRFALINVSGPASPITVTSNITVVGNYKVQYQITVTANPNQALGGTFKVTYTQCGTTYSNVERVTPWTEWVDADTTLTVNSPQDVIDVSLGTRYKFDHYDPSASVIMNGAKTITLVYKLQYYLNLQTNPPGVTTPSGTGWYDAGTYAAISTPEYVPGGSRYRFVSWTTANMAEITDPYSPSTTVLVDEPKTVVANYVRQYQVTFTQSGLNSDATGTVVTVNGTPLTYSNLPYTIWVDENSIILYSYEGTVTSTITGKRFILLSVTGPSSPITVTNDLTITGNYKTQYYLEVSSAYGSPSPTSGWYDAGSSITASVNSPISGPTGTRYVCTGWTGTGSVPASGTGTSAAFTLNAPSSITWNWKTQYLLTVVTIPAGLSPQPTRNPSGEAGPANGWWYDASTSVTLTAQSVTGYNFDYWDVDGASQGTGVATITVVMNAPHTATAHYTQVVTYKLKIETTTGGTTNPAPGTYTYAAGTQVQVTANPSSGYVFDHWELNGTNVGTTTTYTVTMNANYVLKAFFKTAPTPPTVSISPMTASILLGQQVTFTSTVTGGTPPYKYQWYLNNQPVSGATSWTWTFTPTATGTYFVFLEVTDNFGNIARSDPARVTVSSVPVGGYSISLTKQTFIPTLQTAVYTALIILFGVVISLAKRKRK